jgi:hypothetical protein
MEATASAAARSRRRGAQVAGDLPSARAFHNQLGFACGRARPWANSLEGWGEAGQLMSRLQHLSREWTSQLRRNAWSVDLEKTACSSESCGRILAAHLSDASTAMVPGQDEQEESESQASEETSATTATWALTKRRQSRRRPGRRAARTKRRCELEGLSSTLRGGRGT